MLNRWWWCAIVLSLTLITLTTFSLHSSHFGYTMPRLFLLLHIFFCQSFSSFTFNIKIFRFGTGRWRGLCGQLPTLVILENGTHLLVSVSLQERHICLCGTSIQCCNCSRVLVLELPCSFPLQLFCELRNDEAIHYFFPVVVTAYKSLSALTLLIRRHLACKKSCTSYPRRSSFGTVDRTDRYLMSNQHCQKGKLWSSW